MSLFRALNGYVEHLYLTDSYRELHPYYAMDFRGDSDALINMFFTKDHFSKSEGGFMNKKGRLGGKIGLIGSRSFEDVFFHLPSEGGNVSGTFADTQEIFDGIACNDRHMTTHLDSSESYIRFETPPLKEWAS